MPVIKLFDDVKVMKELRDETPAVIHATDYLPAIKKLIEIAELIDLNLMIEANFKDYKDKPPWDLPSLTYMDRLRAEVVIYYHPHFTPFRVLSAYSEKIRHLFVTVMHHRRCGE